MRRAKQSIQLELERLRLGWRLQAGPPLVNRRKPRGLWHRRREGGSQEGKQNALAQLRTAVQGSVRWSDGGRAVSGDEAKENALRMDRVRKAFSFAAVGGVPPSPRSASRTGKLFATLLTGGPVVFAYRACDMSG